jgi:branched-chain amino acid transport system substrate-binding protein
MRTLPRSASLLLLLAGCSEATTDEPIVIRIATQSPLTGGQSGIGLPIKQGAELGLQKLGGGLKTLGYQVELAPYDDQATPAIGTANADAIIADPTILCGVGHYNSGVFIPSSEK